MKLHHAIDDYLAYVEVEKNCSVHTIHAYSFDLHCLERFLTNHGRSLDLTDITASTIRRFIQDQVLNHQIKPRTIQRRISCLKSFSTYCVKENYIQLDFMAGIIAPKGDHKLPHYMELAELQQFIRYLEKDRHPFALRNEALFKLLATTGMRRGEIIDLTWEQIDLKGNTVLVNGKGKKPPPPSPHGYAGYEGISKQFTGR